jgi:hypothetical protein
MFFKVFYGRITLNVCCKLTEYLHFPCIRRDYRGRNRIVVDLLHIPDFILKRYVLVQIITSYLLYDRQNGTRPSRSNMKRTTNLSILCS